MRRDLKGLIITKYDRIVKFADALDEDVEKVYNVLNSRAVLSQEDLIRWSKALDVTVEELQLFFKPTKFTLVT